MRDYLELVRRVRDLGARREDRTGTGTISVFGTQLTLDLRNGFPAVTTKRLPFKVMLAELLCFIHGKHNVADFQALGCHIWDANASADYWNPDVPGDLGRIYGAQWRGWVDWTASVGTYLAEIDQLQTLIDGIKADPFSRRHIVTAWNPAELTSMVLPPCHILFQCHVEGGFLNMRVDMRSVDLFLGLPFNIASYAMLLEMLAAETGYVARSLIFQMGDTHIYLNHLDQVQEMLSREPKQLPLLTFPRNKGMLNLTMDDVFLVGYDPHPTIKAPMAV